MKKNCAVLVIGLAMLAMTAVAQSDSANQSTQNPANPTNATGTQNTTSPSVNQNQGSESGVGSESVEGCVTQVEKDFYIQPVNGGEKVKLNGSHDFAVDVGHHVKVQGTQIRPNSSNSGTNTTGSDSKTAAASSNTTSSTSANSPSFMVTRVTTLAETCPAPSNSANPK